MTRYLLLAGCLIAFSCSKREKKAEQVTSDTCTSKSGSRFEMYQMSEMAALMEQMYVDNQHLKERIIKGDTVGKFPSHFLEIHKAAMTDESDNDAFFKAQAAVFIKSQELIYEDPKNAKQHFNDGVNACVSCHQQKCMGPIPRIKKLYIK